MTESQNLRLAALIWGILPLATSVGMFVLWLIFGWRWLMIAGFVNIAVGAVMMAVGFGLMAAFVRNRPASKRRFNLIWYALILSFLLGSIPPAATIVMAMIAVETRFSVTVVNKGDVPLTDFELSGGGTDVQIGTIAPGQTLTRHLFIELDGALGFRTRRNDDEITGTVDEFVTHNKGGQQEIVFEPSGEFSVRDPDHGK